MRKMFLDDLPRTRKGVDWSRAIGHVIDFIYDDVSGFLEIVEYHQKGQVLTILYNEQIANIRTGCLQKSRIKKIINPNLGYRYKVEEIVEGLNSGILKITSQIKYGKNRGKGYEYTCLICGNTDKISESNLKNKRGCSVCGHTKVVKGINDISTTHPYLLDYFVNPTDAYSLSHGSEKEVILQCTECCYKKKCIIKDVVRNNFSCPMCSDGISIPEKFMMNVLDELKVKYSREVLFDWSKSISYKNARLSGNKYYDFYIPDYNLIIETHGMQHYKESFYLINKKSRSLQEERENDALKRNLALDNGIQKYISLDCRYSDFEYLKEVILTSKLKSNIPLDSLSEQKLVECFRRSLSGTIIKEVCKLWEENYSIQSISDTMNVHRKTVRDYLKKGSKVGWCSYNPDINKRNPKEIVQLTKSGEFIGRWESATVAENILNINQTHICSVCNGKRKSTGGYRWMYKEDYDQYIKQAK